MTGPERTYNPDLPADADQPDEQLRTALQRVDAPHGFAERLLAAAERSPRESQLREALRPVAPPEGFAEAVLRKASAAQTQAPMLSSAGPRKGKLLAFPRPRLWSAGAGIGIAAALMFGLGLDFVHVHERHTTANRQFEMASQIEQQTLDRTRERLRHRGIDLGQ